MATDQSGWSSLIKVPRVALMMPPPMSTTSIGLAVLSLTRQSYGLRHSDIWCAGISQNNIDARESCGERDQHQPEGRGRAAPGTGGVWGDEAVNPARSNSIGSQVRETMPPFL